MRTEVTNLSDCKREVLIEYPAEEVAREFDKVTGEYARHANVPGFRPGRTPKSVVKLRFRDSIRGDVIQHLVSHGLQHAIVDHKLRVVGDPSFDNLNVEEGQPLAVKATLEVLPEVNLTDYKELAVTKRVPPITETSVDQEIERLREQHAELIPVEGRPAQDGDFVSVDIVGKFLTTEEQDLQVNDLQIELGNPNVQAEFTENLRGVSVGEEKTFRVNYPEDFSSKGLAGKEVEYTATVTAVRAKELPELDDEFAKGLGEFEGLADLRQRIKEELESAAERHATQVMRDELLDKLVKLNPFDVPSMLADQQAKARLEALVRNLIYQRMQDPEAAFDLEQMRGEARQLAINDVRGALILERIAELESITVDDTEIDEEIQHLAEHNGQTFAAMKSRLTKEESLDNIRDNLKNRKALDIVVAHAKITTETVASEASEEVSDEATESATEQG